MANSRTDWIQLSATAIVGAMIGAWCLIRFGSSWLELWAFELTIIAVFLLTKRMVIGFPIGIISLGLYAISFYQGALFADASLQLFFIVLSVHGWLSWSQKSKHLPVSRISSKLWLLIVACWVVGTLGYLPIIQHFKGAQPLWDTTLTVASVLAQICQNRKLIENWLMWIAINAAYIPLYLAQKYYLTAILYGLLIVVAAKGYLDWRLALRLESLSNAEPLSGNELHAKL